MAKRKMSQKQASPAKKRTPKAAVKKRASRSRMLAASDPCALYRDKIEKCRGDNPGIGILDLINCACSGLSGADERNCVTCVMAVTDGDSA